MNLEVGVASVGNLDTVYQRLREAILDGTLPGGEVLNQVHLSRRFGVSRTPVREALRMLQAEGLVESQFQQRMRVTAVTPQEVDAVYATWILVDALCMAMTVPRITDEDLATIRTALERMRGAAAMESAEAWEREHRAFHDRLLMYAGPVLRANIDQCWDRSERTRKTRARAAALSWHTSDEEHAAIVEAYATRSVANAVQTMSTHLARTAVSVIGHLDPSYEPRAIRQALGMIAPQRAGTLLPEASPGAAPALRRKHK